MPNVVVKESHLTFGGISYFRGNAESVALGSIGEKRTPLTGQNYLEVKDQLPISKELDVKSQTVEIDFEKSGKVSLGATVPALGATGVGDVDASVAHERLSKGDLKLMKLSVLSNEMRKAINEDEEAIDLLAKWGRDARVVSQVFIVVEASLAKQSSTSGGAKFSLGKGGLKADVNVGVDGSKKTSVTLSAGSCFAYLLAKPTWNAGRKKNRTEIEDLNDDQWGAG